MGCVDGFCVRISPREKMVSHTAWRGPIFNDVYNASRDPGSFLHVKLGPVPGFSGWVGVFCYTGT